MPMLLRGNYESGGSVKSCEGRSADSETSQSKPLDVNPPAANCRADRGQRLAPDRLLALRPREKFLFGPGNISRARDPEYSVC